MSQLTWDSTGQRYYETGIDRGVLYTEEGVGVTWNGLTGVDEKGGVGDVTPLYYDGVKYFDMPSNGVFEAILKAFTYPDEFSECEGVDHVSKGLYLTDQPVKTFGLSYRTLIGNDVDGDGHAYKIHLLYNLTASSSDKSYQTMTDTGAASDFAWNISGVPEWVPGYRPTAHVIIDTRTSQPQLISDLEEILYGTETTDARLPTVAELVNLFEDLWKLITITDNGDGTWTATSDHDETIVMTDATTFQINEVEATYLDNNTYTVKTTPSS